MRTNPFPTLQDAAKLLQRIASEVDNEKMIAVASCLLDEFGEAGWPVFDDWYWEILDYRPIRSRNIWRCAKSGGKHTYDWLEERADIENFRRWHPSVPPPTALEIDRRRQAAFKRLETHKTEAVEEAAKVRIHANQLWKHGKPFPGDGHSYLRSAGLASHGTRIWGWTKVDAGEGLGSEAYTIIPDVLLVPMMDDAKAIHNLQGITHTGETLSLPGGRTDSLSYLLEGTRTNVVGKPVFILAEHFDVAATVHQATGRQVHHCFDHQNMVHTARALHARWKHRADIILALDDDDRPEQVQERRKTIAMALELGIRIARPAGRYINPMWRAEGDHAIVEMIEAAEVPSERRLFAVGTHPATNTKPSPSSRRWEDLLGAEQLWPVDILGASEPPALPLNRFPWRISQYAREQGQLLGCDPAVVAISALVALSSRIPPDIKIQLKRHSPKRLEPACLWAAVMTDGSAVASRAIAAGIAPLVRPDAERSKLEAAAETGYQQSLRAWRVRCREQGSEGHPKPERTRIFRSWVSELTVSGLVAALQSNPRGILCAAPDLSEWLGIRSGRKDIRKAAAEQRAHRLAAYKGGDRVVASGAGKGVPIANWLASMVGSIAPASLACLADDLDRHHPLHHFMFLFPRVPLPEQDRPATPNIAKDFDNLFDAASNVASAGSPVKLTEGAHQVCERFEAYTAALLKVFKDPGMQAWLINAPSLFARLLLTVHVCGLASQQAGDEPWSITRAASESDATIVAELVLGGLFHHAVHLYLKQIDVGDRYDHIRQVARLILAEKKPELTRRDLMRFWRKGRSLTELEIDQVMNALCDLSWLEPDGESNGRHGRANRWLINPDVYYHFDRQAAKERARRQEVRAVLGKIRPLDDQPAEFKLAPLP